MLLINKKLGETPLQTLQRLRKEKPFLAKETLSYIGRLDPMAEGQMIVLVGKEENQNRHKYLNLDKEYLATFVLGFSTDTGDLLGLVEKELQNYSENDFKEKFKKIPEKLLKIKKQKYPWFSCKHVGGRALFDWYKSGQKNIKRPERKIKIFAVDLIGDYQKIDINIFQKYLNKNIQKVLGDFRQKAILKKWQQVFSSKDFDSSQERKIILFSLKIKCSTGTYIRALNEEFEKIFKIPTVLFSLKREKIFLD